MTVTPNRWRQVVLGGAVVVLVAWCGMTYLVPASSYAAGSDDADEHDAAPLQDDVVATTVAERESPWRPQDWAPVTWAADPFHRYRTTLSAHTEESSTTPVTTAVPRPRPALVLTGIIGGTPPTAIVNGKILAVGDEIADGIMLTSIHETAITVRDGSTTYELALP